MFNIFGSEKKPEPKKEEPKVEHKQIDLGVTVNRVFINKIKK
jgi:hypothetical protein